VEDFASYQEQHGTGILREIISEELPQFDLEMEEAVARVLERNQQSYKKLATDFFNARVLPTNNLGSTCSIQDNASASCLESSYSQLERDLFAASDADITHLDTWTLSVSSSSSASTEPLLTAYCSPIPWDCSLLDQVQIPKYDYGSWNYQETIPECEGSGDLLFGIN
jgi:hypothetical protein